MRIKHTGFTLMEMMVVVAILGIIASIALPSYQRLTMKANRADAKTALNIIANEQARFFAINRNYTDDVSDFSLKNDGAANISASGHFSVSVAAGPTGDLATSYTLTARPNTVFQRKDTCTQFTLNSAGLKTANPSVAVCWE